MVMAKKKNSIRKELFNSRSQGVDRILIFRFFKLLHGRFWGFGFILSGILGATIGYIIRPDLFDISIPLSELGTDVRTAPFFAGSMFFAAYSLWRWRTYLKNTLKNSRPVIPLVSLTILGLYLIALMPVTWEVWPHRFHNAGVILAGLSMSATVLMDSILSKNRKNKNEEIWKIIKLFSFTLIISGGIVVILSLEGVGKLNLILLGEFMMFAGYSIWILLKIFLGEGSRSAIGKLFHKLVG